MNLKGGDPQREPSPKPTNDPPQLIEAANSHVDRLTGMMDRLLPFGSARPLDRLPSIKLKLSILILAGIGITISSLTVSYWLNVKPRFALVISVALALALVQMLARGITSPLREMSKAADAMAAGDLDQRVQVTGTDEVGQLGHSFNEMAVHIADLERQRRDLIANVSHELRTPIAVLQGNLENMVDGVGDTSEVTIATMLRQTTRLARLVDQLMDLSRLEAGAAPMRVRSMDLVAVARDAVQEALMRDPEPLIDLRTPMELAIEGDPERLHQVLMNLLDNAIRFHEGPSPIELTISSAGDRLTVSVEDSGPGIPPDELEQIFERFHRVGPDRSTVRGGSGLGLSICQWIIDLHQGSITAANRPTGGAVISFHLPVGQPARDVGGLNGSGTSGDSTSINSTTNPVDSPSQLRWLTTAEQRNSEQVARSTPASE